jgi:AbrB family looped-hinge helix DNA binding protein
MNVTTLTSKGQVTIPSDVRAALDLNAGDKLIFIVEEEHIVVVPARKRSLLEYFGAFPATQPYPGHDAIRQAVGQALEASYEQADAE